jgi:hypothetical protein
LTLRAPKRRRESFQRPARDRRNAAVDDAVVLRIFVGQAGARVGADVDVERRVDRQPSPP